MPDDPHVRVLLVEDSAAMQDLIRLYLREARSLKCDLDVLSTLGELEATAPEAHAGVVLLDLTLPDSGREESLQRAKAAAPKAAIVIVTGNQDEEFAARCIKEGASDYVVKDTLSPDTLARSIRLALARRELEDETRRKIERMREENERVRQALAPVSPAAAKAVNAVPLNEAATQAYERLAADYADLLELAVDEHAFTVDHGVREKRGHLAARLGAMGAAATDVVALHASFVKRRGGELQGKALLAYLDAGRVLLLGIMGDLADHYRRHVRFSSGQTSGQQEWVKP